MGFELSSKLNAFWGVRGDGGSVFSEGFVVWAVDTNVLEASFQSLDHNRAMLGFIGIKKMGSAVSFDER
jgi:hypothetical protein